MDPVYVTLRSRVLTVRKSLVPTIVPTLPLSHTGSAFRNGRMAIANAMSGLKEALTIAHTYSVSMIARAEALAAMECAIATETTWVKTVAS